MTLLLVCVVSRTLLACHLLYSSWWNRNCFRASKICLIPDSICRYYVSKKCDTGIGAEWNGGMSEICCPSCTMNSGQSHTTHITWLLNLYCLDTRSWTKTISGYYITSSLTWTLCICNCICNELLMLTLMTVTRIIHPSSVNSHFNHF